MTVAAFGLYYWGVSPTDLAKEITSGKFHPVYYFFGSEDYRIKEASKTLVAKFLPASLQKTNHVSLSAAKEKFEDILGELSVFPMLGEKQVFTISDIQSLTPSQITSLLNLLKPPDPNRVVILASPSARMPRKNSKTMGLLTRQTAAVEFGKLPGGQARGKIKAMVAAGDIKIDAEALEILVELAAGDLGGINSEVTKLMSYVGEGGTITRNDIAEVCSDYQVFRVFDLAREAALGNFDKAMKTMDFLLRRGERPTSLLFWFGEHFIGLYIAQNRRKQGSLPRDATWKYKGQFDLFTNEQLQEIIGLIARADAGLRNNVKPENLILERLIYSVSSMRNKNVHA